MKKSEVLQEVKDLFGFVPGFIEETPEYEAVPMWGLFRDLAIAETAIPRKYKVLLEIATAAVLHDEYRLELSTEWAKSMDITDEEIREAVTLAEMTAFGSTWLNGMQFNFDTYQQEFCRMIDAAKKLDKIPAYDKLETREDVYRDVKNIFGMVPEFISALPDSGVAHFWKVLRFVYIEDTHIPAKYKELIGLAVASVIPCRYCSFYHTESARTHGASEDEVKEAVLLAARIRTWGIMMYGTRYDLEELKKEARKMIEAIKKRAPVGVR